MLQFGFEYNKMGIESVDEKFDIFHILDDLKRDLL